MSKNRDPLALSAHWHVDCALSNELPDDRVVSSRFLVQLPFGAVTLILLVLFGLKLSNDLNLHTSIADWKRRLTDSRIQVAGIKQMQRDYTVASYKIEQAHRLAFNRISVYSFLTEFAHTRPEQMSVSSIESTAIGIVVRGTLGESSERSTLLIGRYVEQLSKNPQFAQRFEITVTSFERDRTTDQQNFELTFRLLPPPS